MNREQYEKELAERQQKHLADLKGNNTGWKPCMHDQCSNCHGTGLSQFGYCFHNLYCNCPKCVPYGSAYT